MSVVEILFGIIAIQNTAALHVQQKQPSYANINEFSNLQPGDLGVAFLPFPVISTRKEDCDLQKGGEVTRAGKLARAAQFKAIAQTVAVLGTFIYESISNNEDEESAESKWPKFIIGFGLHAGFMAIGDNIINTVSCEMEVELAQSYTRYLAFYTRYEKGKFLRYDDVAMEDCMKTKDKTRRTIVSIQSLVWYGWKSLFTPMLPDTIAHIKDDHYRQLKRQTALKGYLLTAWVSLCVYQVVNYAEWFWNLYGVILSVVEFVYGFAQQSTLLAWACADPNNQKQKKLKYQDWRAKNHAEFLAEFALNPVYFIFEAFSPQPQWIQCIVNEEEHRVQWTVFKMCPRTMKEVGL